jgi:hypothetical protein
MAATTDNSTAAASRLWATVAANAVEASTAAMTTTYVRSSRDRCAVTTSWPPKPRSHPIHGLLNQA